MSQNDMVFSSVKQALQSIEDGRPSHFKLAQDEALMTATSVVEIADSARKLLAIFNHLSHDREPETCLSLLEDFREELRHILYHIGDNQFLSVIQGSTSME